jgi:hypothetical protein
MAIRRMKTYTAQNGYVYQYYFVGQRAALAGDPCAPAIEYIFDVTLDRGTIYAISVFLRAAAVETWMRAHERPLTQAEQYAAAKLRLLHGLEEMESLAASERRLTLDPENIEELLAGLNL